MHFRLFNKPSAFGIKSGKPAMWIDGMYEDYHPAEPYEGYVNIHGSVGLMKVRVIDSNLPPGASVFIDQLKKTVVVKWLKYSPPTQEIKEVPNGSFENDSFWEITGAGTPARIESGWSPNGKGNLTYRDQKGEYKVYGAWAPVSSRTRQIEIKGKVEHGKSSKGNASCGVGLAWFDANKNPVREDMGSVVDNGGKGRWYNTSGIYSADDASIRFVRPMIRFTRRKQNHPIHIGQIEWDHVYTQGYNEDEQLFVEVEVTDSTGNTARHRGVIDENNLWITSQPYSIASVDSMQSVGSFASAFGMGHTVEFMTGSGFFVAANTERTVWESEYRIPYESMRATGTFLSAKTTVVASYSTYAIPPESLVSTGLFLSSKTEVVNIIRTLAPEAMQSAGVFIGGKTQ